MNTTYKKVTDKFPYLGMNSKEAEQAGCPGGYIETPGYEDLVSLIGTVLIETSSEDYSGNSLFLLRNEDKIGYLSFGWGSCSGCDALQACDTAKDYQDLYEQLHGQTRWFDTASQAILWIREHDWEGDYCPELGSDFQATTIPLLQSL